MKKRRVLCACAACVGVVVFVAVLLFPGGRAFIHGLHIAAAKGLQVRSGAAEDPDVHASLCVRGGWARGWSVECAGLVG